MEHMKRILAIGVILLFIGMSLSSSTGFNTVEKSIKPVNGKTLYVGGSGPGNYTKIQDAINDSENGDTVFVYSGIYNECLIVNVSIVLKGENKNNTIIEIDFSDYIINILADKVTISGFSIINNGFLFIEDGILINSDYNCIIDNIISTTGISVDLIGICNNVSNNIFHRDIYEPRFCCVACGKSNNIIYNNIIKGFYIFGIICSDSSYNKIIGNNINRTGVGIYLINSTNCEISRNKILNKSVNGIALIENSSDNYIFRNDIRNNQEYGIFLYYGFSNRIEENNFIKNKPNAFFKNSRFNSWDRNYWNRPRILPKLIRGEIKGLFIFWWAWTNIDWRPALKPYDIEG
jgi:parallel beta-helix repeat protein